MSILMSTPTTKTPVTLAQIKKLLEKTRVATNNKLQEDIVRLINRYYKEDKRPLYTYCNVTGVQCAMTGKEYFAKRMALVDNDIVRLFTEYVSRSGKAEGGTTKTTTTKRKSAIETVVAPPRTLTSIKGIDEWNEIQHQHPVSDDILIRRYNISVDGEVVCQWDEFYGTEKRDDEFYIGDKALRMDLRSRKGIKIAA